MIHFFLSSLLILVVQCNIYFQTGYHSFYQNNFKSVKEYFETKRSGTPVISPQDILFYVKHSQSPNVVVYQANITSQKSLDDKKPIDVFWLMNTKGKTTESLTSVEWKLAFGFKITQLVKGKKYRITLNAIKDREIIISQDSNGKVESFMTVNGQLSKLRDVFIKFEQNFYIPDVKYVEFIGNNIENGKLTAERVWAD